jgi:CubicO group peptidase (beta-lactamase class C family)
MSTLTSTGQGWKTLEETVDSLVKALIEEQNLPGMTVAVTKEGRLLLSKGYGYALIDAPRKLPMKPCMRSKIGSVTKAVVTGPSAFQLMKSKNIDPKSQKLYGPKGIFGGMFDADIDIGIKAHAPTSAQWKEWYEQITIQHLLDHKAGFTRSGDEKGAAAMFHVSEEELTYTQVHRHFLRTRELLHEPGTESEYSNHGFGLWTLLIEKISGKPYPDYVREDYLKPMKLHNAVRPERAHPDSCDASNHTFNSDREPDVFPFEEHGLGLAAGGFRSSAQDLVRLTALLDKKYTTAELDNMGWGKTSKGKLSHNGKASGGTAQVTMFPEGYRSNDNLDLSEVHVAVATNVQMVGYDLRLMSVAAANGLVSKGRDLVVVALVGTRLHIRIFDARGKMIVDKAENELVGGDKLTALKKQLSPFPDQSDLSGTVQQQMIADATSIAGHTRGSLGSLTDKIALAVPASNVPATFDIWKQGKSGCSCEYARCGVPANQYQQVFDEAAESGYRLEWIDGYADDGKAHFNVIFRTNEQGIAWASHHHMTGTGYQQQFDKYRDEGFSLDHVDSYVVGNDVFYAAIWTKSGDAVTAYHGRTATEHQESFDSLKSDGWRPKAISVASLGGTLRYTALYTRQAIGSFAARSFLTPQEYQTEFDQNKASGRHLRYLNSYLHEGKLRFSAIWAEKPEVSGLKANHGLTAEQYLSSWEDAMSSGFRTRAISACEEGGKVRYAVYWTK